MYLTVITYILLCVQILNTQLEVFQVLVRLAQGPYDIQKSTYPATLIPY